MSAWIIGLGLAAGYFIQKKFEMGETIEAAAKKVNGSGPTEGIRKVQRTVPDSDKYEDINVAQLPAKDAEWLRSHGQVIREARDQFEKQAGPPPIQGVWLNVAES